MSNVADKPRVPVNAAIIEEPEASFELRLTASQAEQLTALIDIAVKSAGLRVASAGLYFVQRIQQGLQSAIVPAATLPTARK